MTYVSTKRKIQKNAAIALSGAGQFFELIERAKVSLNLVNYIIYPPSQGSSYMQAWNYLAPTWNVIIRI